MATAIVRHALSARFPVVNPAAKSRGFCLYKAEDRKRVEPLLQALQADGLSVWWDQHIETGDDWREMIERQLDAAKCVVVAWSKRTEGPDGRFVRDEATRAQQRHG